MSEIVINGRFVGQHLSGVNRYSTEMLSRLTFEGVRCIAPTNTLAGLQSHMWEQLVLPKKLKRDDVLLSLTNSGPLLVQKQLLVVHDIAMLDHPEWFPRIFARLFKILLPKLTKRAAICITDSEFSRQRLIDYFNLPTSAVHCIYPGVSSDFHFGGPRERQPYALAYDVSNPRKNFVRLLEAWKIVRLERPEFKLKIFGPLKLSEREKLADEDGIELLGYVDDKNMPTLFRNASLLIYPSLYEGFGLPILEALLSGTPVVASDIEVFRELFAGYVTFVNPFNVESIAGGILGTLINGDNNDVVSRNALYERFNYDVASRRILSLARELQ